MLVPTQSPTYMGVSTTKIVENASMVQKTEVNSTNMGVSHKNIVLNTDVNHTTVGNINNELVLVGNKLTTSDRLKEELEKTAVNESIKLNESLESYKSIKSNNKNEGNNNKKTLKHKEIKSIPACFCKLCDTAFSTVQQFIKHIQTHEGPPGHVNASDQLEKEVEKSGVNESIKPNESLESDKIIKSNDNNDKILKFKEIISKCSWSCKICDKGFSSEQQLDKHSQRHEGPPGYFCEVCSKGFYSLADVMRHKEMTNCHTGEIESKVRFVCKTCGKIYVSSDQLAKHELRHVGGPPLHFCDLCHKSFYEPHFVLRHKQKFHAEKANFVCDVCNKSFTMMRYLEKHKICHNPPVSKICHNPPVFKCQFCDRQFASKSSLKTHVKFKHVNRHLEKYQCDMCPMKFVLLKRFEAHVARHSRRFSCDKCDESFYYPYILKKHIYYKHSNEFKYKCDICEQTFRYKHSYDDHIARHNSDWKFECNICDKKFIRESHLTAHMVTHSEDRNYVCEVCGKSFKASNTLKTHQLIHTGVRGFVCGTCGRGFVQKSTLETHIKLKHLKQKWTYRKKKKIV